MVCTTTMSFIHWHGSTACLTANDYFLSFFFARLTAEHPYTWDTLYFYQMIYPTICDVTHPLFDM